MSLEGKSIAIITSQVGVEKAELTSPREAIISAGGRAVHAAPASDDVQSMVGDVDKDETFTPDATIADLSVDDFDAVVLPGGTVNADTLRLDDSALGLIKAFAAAGKPIAAICHGPWALVETGLTQGKTLTSYPSLRTDIVNAGGTWVDETMKHCTAEGFDLITSRNPDDLDAFNAVIIDVVGQR